MASKKPSYKTKYEESEQHKIKLVHDLVDFAVAWRNLREGLSVAPKALGNYVTVDTMADIVFETFTKPTGDGEDVTTDAT